MPFSEKADLGSRVARQRRSVTEGGELGVSKAMVLCVDWENREHGWGKVRTLGVR